MTIREIERRSGLERTNVRFYEREGLLNPVRRENGYRDYSEEDLALLLKIKLLRRLGFSLEEVRTLAAGDAALGTALERRLTEIEGEHRALDAAGEVCQKMRREDAAFPTLDAERYLDAYDQALQRPAAPAVPESDRVEPVRCPWRRLFARMLDLAIVSAAWLGPVVWAMRINIGLISSVQNFLMALLNWVFLAPLEALCISRWGTTPGKWLMGIRLEHVDGRRLSFSEAAYRVWRVFVYGEGCGIPLVNFYRNWKSYRAVMETQEGPVWDEDTAVIAQPFRWQHAAGYVAVRVVVLGLVIVCAASAGRPIHRGELTAAEFAENYNGMARFYGMNTSYALQPDGTFIYTLEDNVFDLERYMGPNADGFAFTFAETDGILTKVSFLVEEADAFDVHAGAYDNRAALALAAFGWSNAHFWEYRTTPMSKIAALREGVVEEVVGDCRLRYEIAARPALPDTRYTVSFRIERIT